jgi:hypothetical protein
MKKYIFISVFFFLMFFLSACSKPMPEGRFPFDQTPTNEGEVSVMSTRTKTVLPTPESTETYTLISTPFPEVEVDNDYFIYSVDYGDRTMFLYDLENVTQHEIFGDYLVGQFAISSRNQIAFTTMDVDKERIYLSVYPYEIEQTRLIFESSNDCFALGWSPTGQYLSYYCRENGQQKLYIWNGYISFPIYESVANIHEFGWGNNNRLAFVDTERNEGRSYGEVYIWNEIRILNVSQNPDRDNKSVSWSKDGKLAFLSEGEDDIDILIWDGQSMENGMPDRNTYRIISSAELDYYSHPIWKSNNELSFSENMPDNPDSDYRTVKTYLWDSGEIASTSEKIRTNCSRSTDDYLSCVDYSSMTVYVMDNNGDVVFEAKGHSQPAWWSNGNLLYCEYKDDLHILNMWDREQIIELNRGYGIEVEWINGQVLCNWG